MTKFFKLKENKTTIKTEILAGLATFMSMAYIIFLAPDMLSKAGGGSQMYNAVFIATCLAAFIGTLLTALIANWPIAQAPGIGVCGFFTYTILLKLGYSYPVALFLNFIAGILLIICSISGIREKIIKAIPENLKIGMSVGIGLFIAFIGLKNGGIIVPSESTYIGLIDFSLESFGTAQIAAILTLLGVLLIATLKYYKIKASVIITIFTISLLSIPFGITKNVSKDSFTPLSVMFKDFKNISLFANIEGFFESVNITKASSAGLITLLIVVFCLFLSNMFDSIGTLIAVANASNLKDEKGEIKGLSKALMSDAVGTAVGTCFGAPTVTSYLESSIGVSEGGRTGLTSLTTSILFLLAILIGPFCNLIPSCATSPALIYVGTLMLYQIKNVNVDDVIDMIPTTIAILFIPLTCDIATGIALSFISYTILKLLTGKFKDISVYMYIVSILFLFYFMIL